MNTIREYETNHEQRWHNELQPDGTRSYFEWLGKVSIDLAWVASCRPYYKDSIVITLAGNGMETIIRGDYSEFMLDWVRAKFGADASQSMRWQQSALAAAQARLAQHQADQKDKP